MADSPAKSRSDKTILARVVLGLGSGLFLALHGFVVFVAIVTSGSDLLKMTDAYVAMIAPTLYPLYCILCACNIVPKTALFPSGMVAILLVLAALFYSFLGLGFLLPLLVAVWFHYYLTTTRTKNDSPTDSHPA